MASSVTGRCILFQACTLCVCGVFLEKTSKAVLSKIGPSDVKVFVSDFIDGFPGPAPSMRKLNFTMDGLYGKPICAGDQSFVPDPKDAPPSFCRYEMAQKDMAMRPDLDFDQYALERVMLAKWMQSPRRCSDAPTCADIVVVPSLTLHQMLQLGFAWEVFTPEDEEGALHDARQYWDEVRSKYHTPEQSFTPIVAIHLSMVLKRQNKFLLQALAEQPSSFSSRVAMTSIESNIMSEYEGLLNVHTGPLVMSLPYPTSLLNNVPFMQDDGAYVASKARNVVISMVGDAKKGFGVSEVRVHLWEQMTAIKSANFMLKQQGVVGNTNTDAEILVACGDKAPAGPNCGLGNQVNIWTLTANSVFCLEPAGDTPTRSHFYVAALSGCIPVVIDGGHEEFDPETPTWWAWRRKQVPTGHELLSSDGVDFHDGVLNYKDFAMVFNASDLLEGRVDLTKELMEMPTKDPTRLHKLRTNLDKVAPLMRYSKDPCTAGDWHSSKSPNCRDAFTVAQQLMVHHAQRDRA